MRISDWSSDVCSSDLTKDAARLGGGAGFGVAPQPIHHAGEIGGAGIPFDADAVGLVVLEQPGRDSDDPRRDALPGEQFAAGLFVERPPFGARRAAPRAPPF